MKLVLFFLLFSVNTWARPIVLLSYFDAFDKAPFNSSDIVAHKLLEKIKNHPDFELKLCGLNTVFDKSFYQLEDCLKALPEAPKFVLGLGESNCNFKMEMVGRNFDKTIRPDNDGQEKFGTPINSNGPKEIGFKMPLAQMFCALPEKNRGAIEVSNNAGSFVCNNLAYQFAEKYTDVVFSFIHVPANNCKNLNVKTEASIENLEAIIKATVKISHVRRIPTKEKELEELRQATKGDSCANEFYRRAKGTDKKRFGIF
jgi:pyrrolidone-carboxylate peptidase